MKTLLQSVACVVLLVSGVRAQSPPAEFLLLEVPQGYPRTVGLALSDDASIIVGQASWCNTSRSCYLYVRWDRQGRVSRFFADPQAWVAIWDISADGRTVIGRYAPSISHVAESGAWRDGVFEPVPAFPGTWSPYVMAVSADGHVIAGDAILPERRAGIMRWVKNRVESLAHAPGPALAEYACGIDGQGRYVLGNGRGSRGSLEAFRVDKRVELLGPLPGATIIQEGPSSANHDGSRIVGNAMPNHPVSPGEGFIWSAPTGMVGLGLSPFYPYGSVGRGIARLAPVVTGEENTRDPYAFMAFLWDPIHGKRYVNDILDSLGVDRQGWTINIINDINHDGTLMTGTVRMGLDENRRAFLVRLPPLCLADCDASGVVDFNDVICFLNRFERARDPRANPVDFFYCDLALDDEIDFNDFLAFLNLYHAGCPR
jgi:uncharacterized membrane protein